MTSHAIRQHLNVRSFDEQFQVQNNVHLKCFFKQINEVNFAGFSLLVHWFEVLKFDLSGDDLRLPGHYHADIYTDEIKGPGTRLDFPCQSPIKQLYFSIGECLENWEFYTSRHRDPNVKTTFIDQTKLRTALDKAEQMILPLFNRYDRVVPQKQIS